MQENNGEVERFFENKQRVHDIFKSKLDRETLPEQIECRVCGKPKQLLQLNSRMAFWVHMDLPLFRQCKYLSFKSSFTTDIGKMYWTYIQTLKERSEKEKEEKGNGYK